MTISSSAFQHLAEKSRNRVSYKIHYAEKGGQKTERLRKDVQCMHESASFDKLFRVLSVFVFVIVESIPVWSGKFVEYGTGGVNLPQILEILKHGW